MTLARTLTRGNLTPSTMIAATIHIILRGAECMTTTTLKPPTCAVLAAVAAAGAPSLPARLAQGVASTFAHPGHAQSDSTLTFLVQYVQVSQAAWQLTRLYRSTSCTICQVCQAMPVSVSLSVSCTHPLDSSPSQQRAMPLTILPSLPARIAQVVALLVAHPGHAQPDSTHTFLG